MIVNDLSNIPAMCKKIVSICTKNGVLDQDDMDRRLGMLVCDKLLDDMNYRPIPTKPQAMRDYDMLSKDQKFRFDRDNPDWRKSSTVEQWMKDSDSAEAENSSNVYWLEYWTAHVDSGRAEKLRIKLLDYNLRKQPNTFQAKPRVVPQPKEVQDIVDMFGGKVIQGDWRNNVDH